jgi:hypothetical protein
MEASMSDFARLWHLIRTYPWYLIIPAVLLASTAVMPIVQAPPIYRIERTILLTSHAPMNDTGDTLAYDFPALSRGSDFQQKVNALLSERAIMVADGAALLTVSNHERVVTIAAVGSDPAPLAAICDAALAVLQRDGTGLWGKRGDTAVNIAPLSTQDTPVAVTQWRDHLAPLGLRALAGALAGLLFAVYRHT